MEQIATTAIAEDQACAHCGYNLRGLSLDGKCPECFTPVEQSLRGNLLKHADPDWLDRLRFGTSLKLWNLVIGLAVTIAAMVFAISGVLLSVPTLLTLVPGAVGLWASFVITTQEPRISLQEDPVTWRKAIRTCAILAFIGDGLSGVGKGGQLGTALLMAGWALSLAGLVTLFGELLYFRRFALRIPDDKLARSTKIVMWGSVICMGLFLLGFVGAMITAAPPGATAVTPAGGGVVASVGVGGLVFGGIACVAAVPGAVFFVWYVVLLVRYRKVFAAAAAQSRRLIPPIAG